MKDFVKLSRVCACVVLGLCLQRAYASDAYGAAPLCDAVLLAQASVLNARIGQESAIAIKGDNASAFTTLKAQRKELSTVLETLKAHQPDPAQTTPLVTKLESLDRNVSTLIEQEDALHQLALAITKMKAMELKLTELPEQIVALTTQHNGRPNAVLAATELLYLNQRLMRSMDTLYANDHIEPEVSFFIGKDSASIQALTQGLLYGSPTMGLTTPDPQTRVALEQWIANYSELEHYIAATRQVLPQVLAAKQSMQALREDHTALLTQLTAAMASLN